MLFGWTWWSDRRAEKGATPATRSLMDLERAVRADPQNANLRVRYGEALGSAGLLDQAVEQLTAALKLNPEHTGALLDLGIIAMQRAEYRTAEGYLQKVLDLSEGQEFEFINDRRELALYYLGEIALTEERYEEAVPFFKGALRIRRDAADTYLALALSYKGMDQLVLAKEQLQIAIAFDPGLAQAQFTLGEILRDEGDELGAAQHFGAAYARAPENPQAAEAVYLLGPPEKRLADAESALAGGDKATAVLNARIAQALDPANLEVALRAGGILEKAGDTRRALELYTNASRLDPASKEASAAVARLGGK